MKPSVHIQVTRTLLDNKSTGTSSRDVSAETYVLVALIGCGEDVVFNRSLPGLCFLAGHESEEQTLQCEDTCFLMRLH